MYWCVKCKSDVRDLCVSSLDREGIKLDFTPDNSEALVFDTSILAELFVIILLDSVALEDACFYVAPYSFPD